MSGLAGGVVDFRIQPPYASFLGIHFFRERPPVEDPVTGNPFGHGRQRCRSFEERSLGVFLAEMDEAGIDSAVVVGQRAATRWGSVDNRDIAELIRTHPGRFRGFAGVNPTDEDAVNQVHAAIGDLACSGVALLPGWCERPLRDDDERVYPVYQACVDLGVPVLITSSHYIGADMSFALPVHIQHVALDFPDLTIIVGHGCWPWTTAACALAMRCTNVYLMPEFYWYLPGMPGASDYVNAANSYLSHRMLYSSCYPSRCLAQALAEVRALPLRPDVQQLVLSGNARRLLGLGA